MYALGRGEVEGAGDRTWMTGTWKDQTEAGRTQLILWSALGQMVFWVGLVFIAWAVGVSVFGNAARPDQSE